MPPVLLILHVDVGGMERQPDLFHPIFRADLSVQPEIQGVVDHGVGKFLGPQIQPQLGMILVDRREDIVPEGLHLFVLQPRFVVHAELDGVDLREDLEKPAERQPGVRREIIRR